MKAFRQVVIPLALLTIMGCIGIKIGINIEREKFKNCICEKVSYGVRKVKNGYVVVIEGRDFVKVSCSGGIEPQ